MFDSEKFVEWVDGFLLGDGCIVKNGRYAIAYMGCKYVEWLTYAMSGFSEFHPRPPKIRLAVDKRRNKVYEGWQSRTRNHIELLEQRNRWYPIGVKRIPQDIRITPVSLLLWYLGDGSYSGGYVTIAAYDFTDNENAFLVDRISKELGINFVQHLSKGKMAVLYLPADQTGKFFDIIGHSDPTGCYPYKFTSDRANQSLSLSAFCEELSVPHSWALIQVNSGRVEVERVNSLIYPTIRGKEQLREIVEKEYRPRDGREVSTLTQEQVLKELRIHPRRIPVLISAAAITPRRTPGGQYRFTREEVDKMHEYSRVRKTRKKIQ